MSCYTFCLWQPLLHFGNRTNAFWFARPETHGGSVKKLKIPFGVIINRAGIGDCGVQEYCKAERIEVLLEIPYNRQIAERYSKGIALVVRLEEWQLKFLEMFEKICGA